MRKAPERGGSQPGPHRFTSKTARAASRKAVEARNAPPIDSRPADFVGHLPAVLHQASRSLLPRILSDEVAFRSSILDRIAFMEGRIVEAIEAKAYNLELSSLPTLLREWRQCLELSLRIVDRTKGMGAGAGDVKVSALLAREALLRHELERLHVLDSSGRIVPAIEPGAGPGAADTSGRAPAAAHDTASAGERKHGGMTTGSLSADRTSDRQAPGGPPPLPTPRPVDHQAVIDSYQAALREPLENLRGPGSPVPSEE